MAAARLMDVVVGRERNLFEVVADNVKNSECFHEPGGIQAAVTAVLRRTGDRKLTALRIWGHGFTDLPDGTMNFGPDSLAFDTFEKHRGALQPLAAVFAAGARMELRGCASARGRGKEMMKNLAVLLAVRVHASEKLQSLVKMWDRPVYQASPVMGEPVVPTSPVEVYDGI